MVERETEGSQYGIGVQSASGIASIRRRTGRCWRIATATMRSSSKAVSSRSMLRDDRIYQVCVRLSGPSGEKAGPKRLVALNTVFSSEGHLFACPA